MGALVATLTRGGRFDPSRLFRMLAASPHRGTDISHVTCGAAVLGVSNRPDFVDSTISCPGNLIAAVSGRLHNQEELARTLATSGFVSLTRNPADVVVAAFRAFGPDAANRMRGEFAAVVTDGRNMWCLRDHLGFRPLFFRDDSECFYAATDARQIVAGADLERQPDFGVLQQIFYGRLTEDMPSAFKGVHRLPKATTLSVLPNGTRAPEVYWHPENLLETARLSLAEVEETFSALFDRAVARCLTGNDVVSLSGGIDSPAVAGFAAPRYRELIGRPLPALSLVFPQFPNVDERSYIESVIEYLGMELHTYELRSRAWDNLENWVQLFDGPIPTLGAPQLFEYYREARRLGFANILNGDIAECVVDLPAHVHGHLLLHGRLSALARLVLRQRQQGASLKKLTMQLATPLVPARLANWYATATGRDFPRRVPSWLDTRIVNEVPYRQDLLISGRRRWAAVQTMPLRGCPITMEAGHTCAEVAGVTVGRPFADIDLWEFFLSLPAEVKYPDMRSKTLLRSLLRGKVPDRILDRRDKTVFDDHVMSQIDYPLLERYLHNPSWQMPGVDYRLLASRLERRDLNLIDWLWLNDLVRVHAFLSQW
jgi:asparagine synthase (glutamine-hydrolysing)